MKKISIIIPCFNGEKFIKRCLNSILSQTYKKIEIIFINDGSTDMTDYTVNQYIKIFEKNHIEFNYLSYKEQRGQSIAVNKALKVFTGDYLVFLDSDDFLNNNYLEKMMNYLEKNTEYGMIRCPFFMYKEGDIKNPVNCILNENKKSSYIFEGLIKGNVRCTNGSYMIRSSSFLDVNPKREIYISKSGQNFQILLPIAFKYKCGYLNECLFNCVIRKNSHSRSVEYQGKEGEIKRSYEVEDILINTVRSITDDYKYELIIRLRYTNNRITIFNKYKDKKMLLKEENIFESLNKKWEELHANTNKTHSKYI